MCCRITLNITNKENQFYVQKQSRDFPSGTNLFRLRVKGADPVAFQKRLAARGVMLSAPQRDSFLVSVNETLNRTSAAELTDAFARALAG